MKRFVYASVLATVIVFGIGMAPAQALNINSPRSQRGQSVQRAGRCGGYYVVRSGDTLGAIARRCGVTVPKLKKANGLRSDRILVGQTLTIPGAAASRKQTVPIVPRSQATPEPQANAHEPPTPTPAIESTVSPW
jgi:LysM repeat protein